MNIETFEIPGLLLLTPPRHGDPRGFFSEVYRSDLFEAAAGPVRFVQDNISRSAAKGTVRGLHYQAPPRAQGKLVRVSAGSVLDVAVDVRHGSPTFGRHVAVELSAGNWSQLWVPPGFLHGFCTLTDNVELSYKVTDFYSAQHDGAIAFDDPDIGVDWPVARANAVLSAKDQGAPRLKDWNTPFIDAV
ncbi:MAG: dTDP-4-dehydrorhamnose 3,5-epimerase [Caulobacteraceae bacterium]